jgi:mannan endo-1,4-beta-mannosidase
MSSSEGPDDEPFRMKPSLMVSPGIYNNDIYDGLDYAVSEMGKRGFTITMCLNNYWHWSGLYC